MKHAGKDALDRLTPLLNGLREIPDLTERSRGVFYLRSRAFLHFHEDPKGLFADLRSTNGDFDRLWIENAGVESDFVPLVKRRVLELKAPKA